MTLPKLPKVHRKLLPVPVLPFAPVRQDERQHYLGLLQQQYSKAGIPDPIDKTVKKEYETAKKTKTRNEYVNVIKRLMFNLKKYSAETKPVSDASGQVVGDAALSSGAAANPDEIFRRLAKMCISKKRLLENRFVMEVPKLATPLPDYVECRRCGEKFSRKSQFVDAHPTKCRFHPGKTDVKRTPGLNNELRARGEGYLTRYWACCQEPKGESPGCKTLPSHVFKPEAAAELHSLKPFRTIRQLRKEFDVRDSEWSQVQRRKKIRAVALDCEMCFTDQGFELMKLSVVDFDTMKPLIDNLVAPEGQVVVDLNSEVSGVYETPKAGQKGVYTFDEVMAKMATLTDEDTIIIGHGLENDLNVLRIVYPRIVDTAVLLSENTVDPMRKDPLKKLAWKYLSRNIQQAEHDPLEDAVVPIEIVKKVLLSKKYQ